MRKIKITDSVDLFFGAEAYLQSNIDGKRVSLGNEYKILLELRKHPNCPLESEKLADVLWTSRHENNADNIRTVIHKLRNELDSVHSGAHECIKTKRGFKSYYFVPNFPIQNDVIFDLDDPISQQNSIDPCAVRPATYNDLLRHGYTSATIAKALVENDYKLYDIAPENEGTPGQWKEYLSSFPETFQYIVDENSWAIVGNFSFLSVTESQAELILSGAFLEKDLNPAITQDLYSAGTDHILFLLNMSLNEEYGSTRNYTMLRKMFLEQLERYAEDDIYFKSMITNVYRSNQESFYKRWGFEFEENHCYTGKIYSLQMLPYPEKLYLQLKNNSQLRDINERLKTKYDEQYKLLSADGRKHIIK